jgi:hypothetical protein
MAKDNMFLLDNDKTLKNVTIVGEIETDKIRMSGNVFNEKD